MPQSQDKQALELEKLQLEITEQKRNIKFAGLRQALEVVQGLSIIAAIIFGVNEFILKDRDGKNQETQITLNYINNLTTEDVASAHKSLIEARDLSFATPIPDDNADETDKIFIQDDQMRREINENFVEKTFALCHFYNVLNQGIKTGLFNQELAEAFLAQHVKQSIDVLGEIQSRLGSPGDKTSHPDYYNFEGMIEFYIRCYQIKNEEWDKLPNYDIGKPGA